MRISVRSTPDLPAGTATPRRGAPRGTRADLPRHRAVGGTLMRVESPMVGTFYRAGEPGRAAVRRGRRRRRAGPDPLHPRGDEAHERGEGGRRGRRARRSTSRTRQPVEFGQLLFELEPLAAGPRSDVSLSEIAPGLRRWTAWHDEWEEDVGLPRRRHRRRARPDRPPRPAPRARSPGARPAHGSLARALDEGASRLGAPAGGAAAGESRCGGEPPVHAGRSAARRDSGVRDGAAGRGRLLAATAARRSSSATFFSAPARSRATRARRYGCARNAGSGRRRTMTCASRSRRCSSCR